MTPNFKKLISLLEELFQLDQPDLDFGLYRIMQAKRAEISNFLENELFSNVKNAIQRFNLVDKATLSKVLEDIEKGVRKAGLDPKDSPVAKDIHQRIDSLDFFEKIESDVYDHLCKFFRRYYAQGDFIAKRVYKSNVYAIPYNGEEIALHWANKDQYYIKSSEYLRDYTFRLRPDDSDHPMHVHFRLSDATETEHNNNKAPNGKERMFILESKGPSFQDFITLEDGPQGQELVVRFEFRRSELNDWPENERDGKKKPPNQQEHILHACQRILSVTGDDFASWIEELGKPHVIKNGDIADYNRLEAHIKRYTSRNTFDFFIHKDLGSFLKRELDFYIKNDVMHLDDIQYETITRVDQFLSKIKVIRNVGGKLIDFLAQIENFQKKLWLKKKFVTETNYCISVGTIPESFYPEIVENQAQCEEWIQLCAIDQINGDLVTPGYSKKVTPEFLSAHPTLMVDTQHFNTDFTDRLLEALDNIDDLTDGILFNSDNFHALSLMQTRFREKIKCVYIDPPYNTEKDRQYGKFLYKDGYDYSTWLAMMHERVHLARSLLSNNGSQYISIDDVMYSDLLSLLSQIYDRSNHIATIIWEKVHTRKNSARHFSVSHDYIPCFAKNNNQWDRVLFPREGKTAYSNPDNDPKGPWKPDPIYANNPYSADYIVTKPNGVELQPPTGQYWRFSEKTWKEKVANDAVVWGDGDAYPMIKRYLAHVQKGLVPVTLFKRGFAGDNARANAEFDSLFGSGRLFVYPKPTLLIERLLQITLRPEKTESILDYFAGSGTTGHSVINMNRKDGGRRNFVLVEMGDYFDSVLLARLKKVTFTPEWKNGKPHRHASPEESDRSPRIFKVIRLESYEDTLNNLMIHQTDQQQFVLSDPVLNQDNRLRESYILRYMLDVETRGSQSLLNIHDFADPESYKLKVKVPGSDESKDINVDLLETFNWLIGLSVKRITAPQKFNATCERDDEKRLRLMGDLQPKPSGPYWFRTVTGTLPDGRNALIIWRKLSGDLESDNLVLEHWFMNHCPSYNDSNINVIWVNGSTTLENIKTSDHFWTVRLIESDFHRRMFNSEEG